MTKTDLVEKLHEAFDDLTKQQAAEYVETIFSLMKETLAKGESLKLSRFGTLLVREKKQRVGRNPQTGEPMAIKARRVVNFKPSQSLRDDINK